MDVQLNDVSAMFDLVHRTYARYYEYCEENLQQCKRHGWMRTTLMRRIRWVGWTPKPTDVMNFAIQSFIGDSMNLALLAIHPRLPRGVRTVAQIHDALIFEAKLGAAADETHAIIKDVWSKPIAIPNSDRSFVMPIDLKRGERWSVFG